MNFGICVPVSANFFRRRRSISVSDLESLRRWGAVDPVDSGVPEQIEEDARSSLAGETNRESHAPADPAEASALRRELNELRRQVQHLEAERDGDDGEASSTSTRRLWVSEQLWDELSPDAVRAELTKSQLRVILRQYPLPADYSLKAGEMSAADRSRASTSVKDLMDSLAKTVIRSTDPVRPLLNLITRLDQGEISTEEVRTMALDSILLSMHGASVLETRRKKLLFGDNKVVGSLFDRKVEKPLLSPEEVRALDALYEHEKHKKKMRTVLGAPRTFGTVDKPPPQPSSSQQSGVNFDTNRNRRGVARHRIGAPIRPHATLVVAVGADPAKRGANGTPPRRTNEGRCAFAPRSPSRACRCLGRT